VTTMYLQRPYLYLAGKMIVLATIFWVVLTASIISRLGFLHFGLESGINLSVWYQPT
jgi:hypothetical protein